MPFTLTLYTAGSCSCTHYCCPIIRKPNFQRVTQRACARVCVLFVYTGTSIEDNLTNYEKKNNWLHIHILVSQRLGSTLFQNLVILSVYDIPRDLSIRTVKSRGTGKKCQVISICVTVRKSLKRRKVFTRR